MESNHAACRCRSVRKGTGRCRCRAGTKTDSALTSQMGSLMITLNRFSGHGFVHVVGQVVVVILILVVVVTKP